MNSETKDEMVRLAHAPNPVLAHIWQQALEAEGVQCKVLGDFLEGGISDISGLTAEVWVAAHDLARAEEIVRQHQHRTEGEATETT